MTLKVINPNWKSPIRKTAEQHAPEVDQWLKNNAANKSVSLAELRAGLPVIAGDLSRQVVVEIAAIIGARIEGDDSAEV